MRPHLRLQPRQQIGAPLTGERRAQWNDLRPRLRTAIGEGTAEEEGGGRQGRRHTTENQAPRRHQGFCCPLVLSKPLNGSA
jgi:hypothetical protein